MDFQWNLNSRAKMPKIILCTPVLVSYIKGVVPEGNDRQDFGLLSYRSNKPTPAKRTTAQLSL